MAYLKIFGVCFFVWKKKNSTLTQTILHTDIRYEFACAKYKVSIERERRRLSEWMSHLDKHCITKPKVEKLCNKDNYAQNTGYNSKIHQNVFYNKKLYIDRSRILSRSDIDIDLILDLYLDSRSLLILI